MSHRIAGRRSILVAVLLTLIALLFSVGAAGAQESSDVEIKGADLSEYPTVRFTVALTGETAEETPSPDEIVVTEDGEPVDFEIVGLTEASVDVLLNFDVSGSMNGEPLAQAKVASLEFIDELPDEARVAVASFGDEAELVSAFTEDRDATRDAINGLVGDGETALYDAVVLSAEQVNASPASRTAVVLLSDGGNTTSDASLDDATAAIGETETDFFAVSLQSGDADEEALQEIADAAGGTVVPAEDEGALSEAYVDLGQQIANQFEVVFQSTTEEPTATWGVEIASTGASTSTDIAIDQNTAGGSTTTAPLTEVEPLTGEGEAGFLEKGYALWIGAFLVAVALGITAFVLMPDPDRPQRRSLRSDRAPVDDGMNTGQRIAGSVRDTATRFADRAVERSEQGSSIDASLDRAGLVMRSGEFVALVVGIAIVAGFLLFLLMGIVGLAIGVLVPIFGAPTALKFLARRRNAKFADQLSDTLILIAGSLRSGFGIGQAMDNVAEEMPDPMGAEFGRAVLETRLGRDMEDALDGVAKRVRNEDFEWVVDAMRIHRQVGGDLAQILDKVSETIRARNRLRRQIDALTAEGRLSGLVLGCLPIGMALVLYVTNPEYLEPLFDSTVGWIMVAVAVGLLVAGVVWLRKLIDVEL